MVTRRRKGNSDSTLNDSENTSTETGSDGKIIVSWQAEHIIVISLLLLVRLAAATWGIVNDCDEVYNYWEPLHLFLHGEGFQTWEYSPVYAIRSYFYIYLHYIPATVFTFLGYSKIVVFTLVRVILGIFCLIGEWYAYRAVSKSISTSMGRYFIFLSIFSSGVFQASTAFVPSSFCMAFCFYIIGAYLNENWRLGIFCVAFSTLVGWPFSAILGLSIVVRMIFVKQRVFEFFAISIASGFCIGSIQLLVDTYYFGKPVIAPMNIVFYNVLSGPGPSLYGEEPLSYYIKNLIVNWNIAIVAAAIGFMWSLWSWKENNRKNEPISPIIWLSITLGAWLLIFGNQPHKEERFLFPIYPFIALFTSLACDNVRRVSLKTLPIGRFANTVFFICFVVLSISRSYSIHLNYGSHIDIYRTLNEELSANNAVFVTNNRTRVCVGKEWHRFPSSFFIPKFDRIGRKVEMCFLQSEFRGLLPKLFENFTTLAEMTRHEPTEMNDLNKEEVSRYVNLKTCDYVIDVDMPATPREPDLREMTKSWKPLVSKPFIDITRSKGFYGFLRAFYVPYYSEKTNVMTTYTLYKQSMSE